MQQVVHLVVYLFLFREIKNDTYEKKIYFKTIHLQGRTFQSLNILNFMKY